MMGSSVSSVLTHPDLAAWIAFEGWAAAFLGLDESKYEWAKYEQQIDLEEELENIATNNMPSQRVPQLLYTGRAACPQQRHTFLKGKKLQVAESMEEGQLKPGTMEMSRFGPQGGARRNQIQHFLQA